jgi:hypothetical protein
MMNKVSFLFSFHYYVESRSRRQQVDTLVTSTSLCFAIAISDRLHTPYFGTQRRVQYFFLMAAIAFSYGAAQHAARICYRRHYECDKLVDAAKVGNRFVPEVRREVYGKFKG